MRKVLHIIPDNDSLQGGPSAAITSIKKALHSTEWVMHLATTCAEGVVQKEECDDKTWCFKRNTEIYKFSFSFIVWALKSIKQYDIVHIHALFSFASVFSALLARYFDVPYIIHPVGVLNSWGLANRRSFAKKISLILLEGGILKKAAIVHFASEAEYAQAMKLNIKMNSKVFPLGVDSVGSIACTNHDHECSRFRGDFNLVWVSRLDPIKNMESLLFALGILRKKNIVPNLLVAGDGSPDYLYSLKILSRQEGVESQVFWLGHLNGLSKAALMSVGSVFLQISLSESFGLSVVEALNYGLPSIVSKDVGVSDQISHSGAGVVVSGDPLSVAQAIDAYMSSKTMRTTSSIAAKELFASMYSIEKFRQNLIELYEEVMMKNVYR